MAASSSIPDPSSARVDDLRGLSAPPEDDATDAAGGMVTRDAGEELALGAPEDYGLDDVVALGEDDGEGPVFGLSFGAASSDGTGAWDLAEIGGLVVNETRGAFDATSDARHDVGVMEEEFDPDDDVVVAVWAPTLPGAPPRVKARVRRKAKPMVRNEYLPYGVIAGLLAGLLLFAGIGITGIAAFGLLASSSSSSTPIAVQPPDPGAAQKAAEAEKMSADEILQEVLGE